MNKRYKSFAIVFALSISIFNPGMIQAQKMSRTSIKKATFEYYQKFKKFCCEHAREISVLGISVFSCGCFFYFYLQPNFFNKNKDIKENKKREEDSIKHEKMQDKSELSKQKNPNEISDKRFSGENMNLKHENSYDGCPDQKKVEGYWASSRNPSEDCYNGKYPFPEACGQSFEGQQEFLEKLKRIEELADYSLDARIGRIPSNSRIQVTYYRGPSPSRLEEGVNVGSKEFYDTQANICWPEGYRSHYIEKFNVRPSREFFEYVMAFNLQ